MHYFKTKENPAIDCDPSPGHSGLCQTRALGCTFHFVECLVTPLGKCEHRVAFAGSHLCHHPQRNVIAEVSEFTREFPDDYNCAWQQDVVAWGHYLSGEQYHHEL